VGLVNAGPITVVVRKGSPTKTMDEWLDPKTRPLIFGCTSINSLTCAIPLAMNELFGPTSKIVAGYQGTAPIRAALVKQEVDALTGWSWDSVKATGMSMINSGEAEIMAYLGEERNSELDELKVPFLNERIKKPEDVAFMRVLLLPAAMLRPWAVPPNTPKAHVATLRKAFQKTLKDPEFLMDAKRVRLDINPRSGQYLADLMIDMKTQMTPEVLSRARKIVGLEK
jgi:tripartite-type tricarboxylate transporter receptor subunit TctC